MSNLKRCLCGCGVIARVRGLARNCYQQLNHKVNSGKTTWAEEEKAGRVLPILPKEERSRRFFRGTV